MLILLTSKVTSLHVLFCASKVGCGGSVKEHWIGIPRLVLHKIGCLTSTATEFLTELVELLVELEMVLFEGTMAGFCKHKHFISSQRSSK